jgi:hypothetical protein
VLSTPATSPPIARSPNETVKSATISKTIPYIAVVIGHHSRVYNSFVLCYYHGAMPNRSRRPADPNSLAAQIVREATGQDEGKNPAAVALGRLGGQKGGPARAASMTAAKRSASAKKAAKARWSQKRHH